MNAVTQLLDLEPPPSTSQTVEKMAEERTFIGDFSPQAVVATDSLSATRPQRLSPTPNPPSGFQSPPDILGQRDEYTEEATSPVYPGTINVVGHDQFNNVFVTNYIHMNPTEPIFAQHGSVVNYNTEKPLLHPLFDKLSHVPKASYDASTPALRRACTDNTRTAVLKAILDWAFDPTKVNIYWMNGMAGTGKTTITYSLSIALENSNILMATFFCSRLVDECTKVDRILPTISYNLARNHAPFASIILEVLKNDPDISTRTLNQQFTALLMTPTRIVAEKLAGRPIVVVIDGLDECANQADVQTLLTILLQRSPELSFKILITSRPEQVIRVGFNRFNRQKLGTYSKLILHDIDRNIVNADIKLYLMERLVDMVDGRSDFQESDDDWPPEDKVDILARQANGLFIYAKTVCDYIGEPGGNISAYLNAVVSREESGEPSGDTLGTSELDRLYRDILDRAIHSGPKARNDFKQILSAVVNIRDPLSARGLSTLLKIDLGLIKSALGLLHSVISVPHSLDAPVSTFHASFPDCLTEPTRSLQHHLPISRSHEMLAKSCFSLMNSSLKENICNSQGRPANDTIANDTISAHIPEGLAYACIYWASHLTRTRHDEIRSADDVRQLLGDFLREHVLHWIECLSLLRQLRVAVESLRVIEGWVLNVYPELSPMVTDARRFAVENFELISDYSLETYHSALIWLPERSIIRKHYVARKPELPKVLVGLQAAWGCCEKIMICGSTVNSVAFSSDGRHVVSGSEDKKVQIWNAATGKLEIVFEGHSSPVLSVAFSSNGSRVVSGSYDVRIWNAATGESEGVFEGHSDRVWSVTFSSDGSHVVSGSSDKTIRIWNVATGESEVFEGHSGSVTSVAFSSDGSHVVSGSDDKTIRIWNTATGEKESVLKGHSSSVLSVAFSSDGRVVSGSSDKTVRIWNAGTGEMSVAKGHSSSVFSVAFSSDGRIVSGSSDKTVRIWNAGTGEEMSVLKGHSSAVFSVAFSNDGSRIVSGSSDETVRIWNAATDEEGDLIKGHSGEIRSVAFSSDGSYVVSGSLDDTVLIWNMLTRKLDCVLYGNSDAILLPDQTEIHSSSPGYFYFSSTAHEHRALLYSDAPYSISDNKAWIQRDSQQCCWIPERYRGFTCFRFCGLKIAFGFSTGNVVVLDLG